MRTPYWWLALASFVPLSFAPVTNAANEQPKVELSLAVVKAGQADESPVVAYCVHVAPEGKTPAMCVYPIASGPDFVVASGEVLTSREETGRWFAKSAKAIFPTGNFDVEMAEARRYLFEPQHPSRKRAITIFVGDIEPLTADRSQDLKANQELAASLNKKIPSKLAEAASARRSLQAALSQQIDGRGRIGDADLGLPILYELALLQSMNNNRGTLEQRLDRIVTKPEDALKEVIERSDDVTPLEASLVKPDVRKALVDLLSSGKLPKDKAASPSAIKELIHIDDRSSVSPKGEWLSVAPWWVIPAAIMLVVLGMLLAIVTPPIPGIIRRRAVNYIERKSQSLPPRVSLEEILHKARTGNANEVRRHLEYSALWMDVAGGYLRALEMLRNRAVPNPPSVERSSDLERLVLDALLSLKSANDQIHDNRNKITADHEFKRLELQKEKSQLERTIEKLVMGEVSTPGSEEAVRAELARALGTFNSHASTISIKEMTNRHFNYVQQSKKLLSQILPDQATRADAEHFLGKSDEDRLPASVSKIVEDARSTRQDLVSVHSLLQPFGNPDDYWSTQSGSTTVSTAAVSRARIAQNVATRLKQIVDENVLTVGAATPENHVMAIEAELRKTRQDRNYFHQWTTEYKSALGLLRGSDKTRLAKEGLTLTELIKSLLEGYGMAIRTRDDLHKTVEEVTESQRQTTTDLDRERKVLAQLRSDLCNADQSLDAVLNKFVGLPAVQAQQLGLRGTAGFVHVNVIRFVESFDLRLLVLNYAASSMAKELEALEVRGRTDLIEALYLRRIAKGLAELQARYIAFLGVSAERPPKDELFSKVLAPALEEAWLHMMLRADSIGAKYWHSNPDLNSLAKLLSIASLLAELLLADTDTKVVRPQLLAPLAPDVKQKFGAERSLRSLPEVRQVVVPYAERGDNVAVDIFEMGIESPYVRVVPTVVALNPAEWRQ